MAKLSWSFEATIEGQPKPYKIEKITSDPETILISDQPVSKEIPKQTQKWFALHDSTINKLRLLIIDPKVPADLPQLEKDAAGKEIYMQFTKASAEAPDAHKWRHLCGPIVFVRGTMFGLEGDAQRLWIKNGSQHSLKVTVVVARDEGRASEITGSTTTSPADSCAP